MPAHQRQTTQLVHPILNRNGKFLHNIVYAPFILNIYSKLNLKFVVGFLLLPQNREALNLTESPTHGIKRERDTGNDFERDDRDYVKKSALHQLQSQLQQSQRASPHNHYNQSRRRSVTPPSPPLHHRNRSIERDHHGHEHRNGLLSFHENQNHSSSRRHMSASPPSSNHRNGTNNTSHNGSNDLLNACSPLALLSGMQFKLFSRGKLKKKQHTIKHYSIVQDTQKKSLPKHEQMQFNQM